MIIYFKEVIIDCQHCSLPPDYPYENMVGEIRASLSPVSEDYQTPWLPNTKYSFVGTCPVCKATYFYHWDHHQDMLSRLPLSETFLHLLTKEVTAHELTEHYITSARYLERIFLNHVMENYFRFADIPFTAYIKELIEHIEKNAYDYNITMHLIGFLQKVTEQALYDRDREKTDLSIKVTDVAPLITAAAKHKDQLTYVIRRSLFYGDKPLLDIHPEERARLLEVLDLTDQWKRKTVKIPYTYPLAHEPAPHPVSFIFFVSISLFLSWVIGFLYGNLGAGQGKYGLAFFAAFGLFTTGKLAAFISRFNHFRYRVYTGLMCGLLAICTSHYIAYEWEFKDSVYRWVQEQKNPVFDDMKNMEKEEAVTAYMAHVLKEKGSHGFFSSLRVRAIEGTIVYPTPQFPWLSERSGFFMWASWFFSALFLFLGALVASVSGKEKGKRSQVGERSREKMSRQP